MKKYRLTSTLAFLLMLSAGSAIASHTVTSSFSDIPIDVGKKIWYSSVVRVGGHPTYPLTIYFTNQRINSPAFAHTVPNAILILDPAVTVATTVFNGVAWVTTARPNERGYYFLGGYADSLTESLPGGIGPVSWTGTFTASRPGVSLLWQTAAAVYSSFSSQLNSLGIKPSDCGSCSFYPTTHMAGTPEKYRDRVIAGAMGKGVSNYTGDFSEPLLVSPGLANANTTVCEGNTITVDPVSLSRGWTSSSPSVAAVSNDGKVTGITAGVARISYILTGYPVWQTLTVTVSPLPTVTAIARPNVLYAGTELILNATTTADGGFSNDAVASWVGPDGFTSSQLRPVRADMSPVMTGVYTLTVTDRGCTVSAKTEDVTLDKITAQAPAGLLAMYTPRASYLNSTLIPGGGNILLWPDGLGNSARANETLTIYHPKEAYVSEIRSTTKIPYVYTVPPKRSEKYDPNVVLFAGNIVPGEALQGNPHRANYVSAPTYIKRKVQAPYVYDIPKKRWIVDPNLVLFAGSIVPEEEPEDAMEEEKYAVAALSGTGSALTPVSITNAVNAAIGIVSIERAVGPAKEDAPLLTFDDLFSTNKVPVPVSTKGSVTLLTFDDLFSTNSVPAIVSKKGSVTLLTFDDVFSISRAPGTTPVQDDNELLTFDEIFSTNKALTRAPGQGEVALLTFDDVFSINKVPIFDETINLPKSLVRADFSRSTGGIPLWTESSVGTQSANKTATADVFADDGRDNILFIAVEDNDGLAANYNTSTDIVDTGPLSTRHTNSGVAYVRGPANLNANYADATRSIWTSARDSRSMVRNTRVSAMLTGLHSLAVSSLSSNSSPPVAFKAIGTAHSPPAICTAHSPPAVSTAHSPPAICTAHSPPAASTAHSPPATSAIAMPEYCKEFECNLCIVAADMLRYSDRCSPA